MKVDEVSKVSPQDRRSQNRSSPPGTSFQHRKIAQNSSARSSPSFEELQPLILDPKIENEMYTNSPNQGKGFSRLGLITPPIPLSQRLGFAFGANKYKNTVYTTLVFIKQTANGRHYFDFSAKNFRGITPYLRQHAYLLQYPIAKELYEPLPSDFDANYHQNRTVQLLDGTVL